MSSEWKQKGLRKSLSFRAGVRCSHIETRLQTSLDTQGKVYAVGDLHGHFKTFRALLHRLKLRSNDYVICLGDMIDRGPDTANLLKFVRQHPNIICIKGNHEQMAIQSITSQGTFEAWSPWMQRGGKSTYGSYIIQANGDLWKAKKRMVEDFSWLDTLPTEIVLDKHRFVHAGYDPHVPLSEQGEVEHLWIRKHWYQSDRIVDEHRTVFFGHSTTTKFGRGGDIALSEHRLRDGRSAWVAVDVGAYNHVLPSLVAVDVQTLQVRRQKTLPSEQWFNDGIVDHQSKKFVRWNRPDQRKESDSAEHYGLKKLKQRSSMTLKREQEEIKKFQRVGVFASYSGRHTSQPPTKYRFRVYRKKIENECHATLQPIKVV